VSWTDGLVAKQANEGAGSDPSPHVSSQLPTAGTGETVTQHAPLNMTVFNRALFISITKGPRLKSRERETFSAANLFRLPHLSRSLSSPLSR